MFEIFSSRVTSESSSISSASTSDSDDSNLNLMTTRMNDDKATLLDQTEDGASTSQALDGETGVISTDQDTHWQQLWQKHFQEQFVKHYSEFIEMHQSMQKDMSSSLRSESGFLDDAHKGISKRKRSHRKKSGSLQKMVANLNLKSDALKQIEIAKEPEMVDADSKNGTDVATSDAQSDDTLMESYGLPSNFGKQIAIPPRKSGYGDEDPDPNNQRAINLKRSHESDTEESNLERIKGTFEMMVNVLNN